MPVQTLTPDNVMTPIGPYSHIAQAGPFIALSATAGVDPQTGQLAGPDTYTQARQILQALRSMLTAVGAQLEQVLHVNVFLLHMEDFEEMNRAYVETFTGHRPARTVVGVAALPKPGARLTMNLTAWSDATHRRPARL
jgi:2-iminobutanoate/2-iminopropanoate deaminase